MLVTRFPCHYDPVNGSFGRGTVDGSPVGNAPVTLFFLEADANHPGQSGITGHSGMDLAANLGTPITALLPGTVTSSAMDSPSVAPDGSSLPQGYLGNYILINHGDVTVLYAHMQSAYTGPAQVNPGDVVGNVGMTGFTTGPHLHWMVMPTNLNPYGRSNAPLLDPIGRFVLPNLTSADVATFVQSHPFFTYSESANVEGVRNVEITIANPPQPLYPNTGTFVPLHNGGWNE